MEPPAGPPPDHLRCTRTDGRQWRCKRRVMENMKLCEIHYLQGRHRQYREPVPESLKIQRKTQTAPCEDQKGDGELEKEKEKVEGLVAGIKRKRAEEPAAGAVRIKKKKKQKEKKCELNLELIRMVLKKEVEKRNTPKKKKKRRQEESEEEEGVDLTRDLPNGRMAISSSSSQSLEGNVGSNSASDVRVGAELGPQVVSATRRCFRSKNIEPMPVGTVQALPCGDENVGRLRKGRRKRCHWCQKSGSSASSSLIKCSSCKKQLFCLSCIKERFVI